METNIHDRRNYIDDIVLPTGYNEWIYALVGEVERLGYRPTIFKHFVGNCVGRALSLVHVYERRIETGQLGGFTVGVLMQLSRELTSIKAAHSIETMLLESGIIKNTKEEFDDSKE